MGTTITRFGEHSSRVEIRLDGTIRWDEMRDHLSGAGIPRVGAILDCIRGFDQGNVSDDRVLLNWRTNYLTKGQEGTSLFRIVELFVKGK